ncbi:MAG: NAD(P)H-dependent oxidoreductase [Burkholderiaceae bacterium]
MSPAGRCRIAVIQGHPDPAPERLCRALADAYAAGAAEAGHTVSRIDVAALELPLLRTQHDFERGALPEALRPAHQAIAEAEHLFIVFPLWLGTMPALLKAFFEQLMRPGLAFAYRERGLPDKLLKGRSVRLVVTMGMPGFVYRWWYGAHAVKGLERNLLAFVGLGPIRRTLLGNVGGAGAAARERWLARMRALGARAQ